MKIDKQILNKKNTGYGRVEKEKGKALALIRYLETAT